jgi:hypothetical protein
MKTDEIRVLYEGLHKGPFRLRDGTPVIKLVAKDKDKIVIHLPGGKTTEVYKRQLRKLLIRDSAWAIGNMQKSHNVSDESLQKAKDTRAIGGRSNRTSREKIEMSDFLKHRDFIREGEKAVVSRIGARCEHAPDPAPPIGEITD